jgi:hypothetical protein
MGRKAGSFQASPAHPLAVEFIYRVILLEAEGRHPVIRGSW